MGQFLFLFLEQTAPSLVAHVRTCCVDSCGCRTVEMASEVINIFYAFGLQLNTFISPRILLEYFHKVPKFEWRKEESNSKHRIGLVRTHGWRARARHVCCLVTVDYSNNRLQWRFIPLYECRKSIIYSDERRSKGLVDVWEVVFKIKNLLPSVSEVIVDLVRSLGRAIDDSNGWPT